MITKQLTGGPSPKKTWKPFIESLKKEDIYDKLLVTKCDLNRVNDDCVKLKTKNAV